MKNFIARFFFLIIALVVIIFLGCIGYKTMVTSGMIEKSPYEDTIVSKGKETAESLTGKIDTVLTDTGIKNVTNTLHASGDASEVTERIIAEKSYISINEALEALSTYNGHFITNLGNVYMFYITGRNDVNTLSADERSKVMLENSKKITSQITKTDLDSINNLIKKTKISYVEEAGDEVSDDETDGAVADESNKVSAVKTIAVYNYSDNTRISLKEEGKINVTNTSDSAETLIYLIGKYISSYRVIYANYNAYQTQ